MKMRIIIHVGLHRTASTFLQREVFPKMKSINFICQDNMPLRDLVLNAYLSHGKVNLISEEGLSGYSQKTIKQATRAQIAKRLSKLFPDAEIILVTRNVDDWLLSMYKAFCNKPSIKYEKWIKRIPESDKDIDAYIKILNKLFKRVLVIPFNLLKEDTYKFVRTICNFMEVPMVDFKNTIHGASSWPIN